MKGDFIPFRMCPWNRRHLRDWGRTIGQSAMGSEVTPSICCWGSFGCRSQRASHGRDLEGTCNPMYLGDRDDTGRGARATVASLTTATVIEPDASLVFAVVFGSLWQIY